MEALILVATLGRTYDVRFRAHSGLKSEIAPCPKSAKSRLTQHSMIGESQPRGRFFRPPSAFF
jgi:hypothetical protein